MRKLLSFFVLVLIGLTMFAQAPQRFTYQAVVRNESNTLVRGTVGVRVSILQGGVDGTVVYQETHTTTTNINGLMTLEIGGGTVVNGDFATIDWATGPYFLKTETDPDGGTNYTIEGTQQLLSVPYALYAGSAANSFSGDYNDLTNVPPMPQIPENVSAFNNDAGYITMDSIPEIPTVPTNVSAFTNDAGYITMDSVPTIPTNVSAFVNDAGYVTQSTLTTNNYITQNDLITNNYVTGADIPTNVSAFTNDAGYITMDSIPAIPTVPTNVSAFVNDAGYVTESSLTTNNYITQNDLITNNYVTEADIPTNVSAFTNDAGYITMDSIPAIPTVPTNVSAFVNDAGYVTESSLTTNNYITQNDLITNNYVTEADIPTNVSAFTNDAGYITMDSIPAIPTVPTNVSAFVNDAGYVTESSLTTNNYITQNDLITNNYVTEADIPTNVSAFINDAGYITMDSVPTIPTNVSVFTNDAGYLTSATVQEAANIPTNVSAFTNDANYITLAQVPAQVNADWNATSGAAQIMNKPTIPTVPTNVSAFTNDANYITNAAIPTNVSAFANDANYITSNDIPAYQVLSISNDTIYLSNGGYAVLPAGFDGNYNSLSNKPDLFSGSYNDLTDKPTIPTVPTNVSVFTNDANYITNAAIPTNVSTFTNDANYITLAQVPAQVNADWNATSGAAQIMNKPTIPTVPTNVSSFTNDANYITSAAIPTNVSTFTNDANYITLAQVPTQVNADWNAASGAAQIMNKPTIPTVPTNVSAFTNDANYITSADVPAIPTNVSSFTNDAGYITMDSIPAIPTVPTNVSAFTNDANYITSADVPAIPTNVSTFTNDADYITLAQVPAQVNADWNATSGAAQIMNKPSIPTVPTNVSAFINDANYITAADVPVIPTNVSTFTNDAGYITMDSIPAIPTVPTNISAFTNDAGYLTEYTEQQVLSISNDTIYLTGGSFAKLPAGFSGSYNDLTDVPENVSSFSNDAGYLTRDSLENITTHDMQELLDRIAALEHQLSLPVLNTTSASSINSTSAISGGAVVSSPTAVTERGICWNTIGTPTISDSHTSDGNGIGNFVSSITSLTPATIYYVRAFATNDVGTGYGPQITFTTFDVPSMVTNYVNVIDAASAVINCSVSDCHGANVTEQGICWNTTGAPTTSDHTQTASLGNANYDINLSALTPATTYYVCAYAVNSEGTGYGNVLMFITSNEVPYVTTDAISVVNATNATGGGNVTSSNGSAVTARGVCWSTNPNPTIADSHTTDGNGIGSFSSSITGLAAGVTYYVRAYATNSTGTGYGEQVSFVTWQCGISNVTDIDGNVYNTVQIGSQCWMKENLKTTKYADGTSISQGSSTSATIAYWYYPNNSSSNKTTYGLLYNWKAVMRNSSSSDDNPSEVQGICPTGWHVPSDAEWKQMEMAVGMSQSNANASGWRGNIAAKLSGNTGWTSSSTVNAAGNLSAPNRNSSGFSALPAGSYYGSYNYFDAAGFWSATEYDSSRAWLRYLYYNLAGVGRDTCLKSYGYSVRCLRD